MFFFFFFFCVLSMHDSLLQGSNHKHTYFGISTIICTTAFSKTGVPTLFTNGLHAWPCFYLNINMHRGRFGSSVQWHWTRQNCDTCHHPIRSNALEAGPNPDSMHSYNQLASNLLGCHFPTITFALCFFHHQGS